MTYLEAYHRLEEIVNRDMKTTVDPITLTNLLDEAVHCCAEMSAEVALKFPDQVADLRDAQLKTNTAAAVAGSPTDDGPTDDGPTDDGPEAA